MNVHLLSDTWTTQQEIANIRKTVSNNNVHLPVFEKHLSKRSGTDKSVAVLLKSKLNIQTDQ